MTMWSLYLMTLALVTNGESKSRWRVYLLSYLRYYRLVYLTVCHLQAWDGRRWIYYVTSAALVLLIIPAIILAAMTMRKIYGKQHW
jgi:hypothetical protein